MKLFVPAFLIWSVADGVRAEERLSIRAEWGLPPRCTPFAPVRMDDLKEELRQTGYRLVIAIHPEERNKSDGQPPARDLYLVSADGSGLRQLTDTPDDEERVPRTSPDGKWFTYNYGDYLVDARTLRTKPHYGGYVWTPGCAGMRVGAWPSGSSIRRCPTAPTGRLLHSPKIASARTRVAAGRTAGGTSPT
jgi:hypothetical protein